MGIVSFPFGENAKILIGNRAYVKQFLADCMNHSDKKACFAGLLAEASEKQYSMEETLYQEVPYVLPRGCMPQHPHTGQTWISKFQTAFKSSAMDRFIYFALKRWCP